MAKFLYIFPHPDDESFGPAAAIHSQIKRGHEVYLLTLNRGGATKMRFSLKKTVEEMGQIRFDEMQKVKEVLNLSGMTILDLEDGGMREMDPRELEKIIEGHILGVRPNIVVTYPVHGISGHHDHLVCHAVVKRVFLELKEKNEWLKRLAMITLPDENESPEQGGMANVLRTRKAFIDCKMPVKKDDREAMIAALNCYESYQKVIEETGIKEKIGDFIHFEIFGEDHDPPLTYLNQQISITSTLEA